MKLMHIIFAGVVMASLAGCAPTVFGVSQERWDVLSAVERQQVMTSYYRSEAAYQHARADRARYEAQQRWAYAHAHRTPQIRDVWVGAPSDTYFVPRHRHHYAVPSVAAHRKSVGRRNYPIPPVAAHRRSHGHHHVTRPPTTASGSNDDSP